VKEPDAVVKLHEHANSSVNLIFRPRPWVKTEVYRDITRELKLKIDAEGVSIPFAQRDVYVFEETTSTA